MELRVFLALDLVGALLTMVVAGFFFVSWKRSEVPLHLLLGVGFALIGLGSLGVSISQFDYGETGSRFAALRLGCRTAGALVLALAYVSQRRHGDARPLLVVAWVVAAVGAVVAVVYLVAPSVSGLPDPRNAILVAHGVQFLAYVVAAAYASQGYRRAPTTMHALVPGAYAFWALALYTWLLIDVSGSNAVVGAVYVWRFAALTCLLLAVALPARAVRRLSRAPA